MRRAQGLPQLADLRLELSRVPLFECKTQHEGAFGAAALRQLELVGPLCGAKIFQLMRHCTLVRHRCRAVCAVAAEL